MSELINLMWPTNVGMWIGYGIAALALISMLGGTVANGGVVNALNWLARKLDGTGRQTNQTVTSVVSGQTMTQEDKSTLDDIHAVQRLEARAEALNCDEMRAAVGTIKDHFFHVHKPAVVSTGAPAAPAIPTNIPPPAPAQPA